MMVVLDMEMVVLLLMKVLGVGGMTAEQTAQIDLDALGDVVYLEGVSGIDGVNFESFQVGREGENSLKISALR